MRARPRSIPALVGAMAFLLPALSFATGGSEPANGSGQGDVESKAMAVGKLRVAASPEDSTAASATVFWITADRAVTNWHIVHHLDSSGGSIEMPDGRSHRITHVVGVDERSDLAVLAADPPFEGEPFELSEALPMPGEGVRIMTTTLLFEDSLREGVVLGVEDAPLYGTTVVVYTEEVLAPGWSGSPVVDSQGEVVGVVRSVSPLRCRAAPATGIKNLMAGEGVEIGAWSPEPTTRFGRAMELGLRARRMRDAAPAELLALYQEAVAHAPDDGVSWYEIGRLKERSGEREDATHAYEQAARLSLEAHPVVRLARHYESLGRTEDAKAARARAMGLDPIGYIFALEREAALGLAGAGRYREASPRLARVARGLPQDAQVRAVYAQCLALTGRSRQAGPQADLAISINPTYAPAHYARGLALVNLGYHETAIESLKRALELDADLVPARVFLIEATFRNGDTSTALKLLAELRAVDEAAAEAAMRRLNRRSPIVGPPPTRRPVPQER